MGRSQACQQGDGGRREEGYGIFYYFHLLYKFTACDNMSCTNFSYVKYVLDDILNTSYFHC